MRTQRGDSHRVCVLAMSNLVLVDHELKIRGWYDPFDESSNKSLRKNLLLAINDKKSSRGS